MATQISMILFESISFQRVVNATQQQLALKSDRESKFHHVNHVAKSLFKIGCNKLSHVIKKRRKIKHKHYYQCEPCVKLLTLNNIQHGTLTCIFSCAFCLCKSSVKWSVTPITFFIFSYSSAIFSISSWPLSISERIFRLLSSSSRFISSSRCTKARVKLTMLSYRFTSCVKFWRQL